MRMPGFTAEASLYQATRYRPETPPVRAGNQRSVVRLQQTTWERCHEICFDEYYRREEECMAMMDINRRRWCLAQAKNTRDRCMGFCNTSFGYVLIP